MVNIVTTTPNKSAGDFSLLVFIMISTLSMNHYKGMPVNLPNAASRQQAADESAAITIDKEGRIFLNKQAVAITALNQRLREQLAKNRELLVIINAELGVEHGAVVEAMDVVRSDGVAKLAIAVKPREDKR